MRQAVDDFEPGARDQRDERFGIADRMTLVVARVDEEKLLELEGCVGVARAPRRSRWSMYRVVAGTGSLDHFCTCTHPLAVPSPSVSRGKKTFALSDSL